MSMVYHQRTLVAPARVCGTGYWSGQQVSVEFRPAPPDTGVVFVRNDLSREARIPAHPAHRCSAPRRTNLRYGAAQVDMVEHVLAALAGLQIDNCEVWVDAQEMPGCDGSSAAYVAALLAAGIVEQEALAHVLRVTRVHRVGDADGWVEARPSYAGDFRIEYRLDYPANPVLGRQTAVAQIAPGPFARELAGCRTFILHEEAEALRRQGLAAHVSTQELLVIGPEGPIDNAFRFPNECARHKALDVLGDLALTGRRLIGDFVAYRSGHHLNAQLAASLVEQDAASSVSSAA